MSITPGTRLGAYEIVSLIGAGGMGEVYRATDTKLGRDVALKILPASFSNDPERVARFRREAQVLASLNHPHIAQIFGFEHADGLSSTFIVMEFVDGEELAHRLARGALPLDEALPIARHIAEALEGAHEHGIIHRDLKPANIKVKPDGTVKVLDFGLAKATDLASSSSASVMNSPTLSLHATAAGVILGTAAYMAPEQARGRAVDKRADLWAFGCVLFEMLTGQRAFGGDDVTDTIVAVVSKEPDWSLLPTAAPPGLRRLLARCLEKDPKRRLDSAAAARLEIDDVLAPSATASGIALPAASPPAAAFSWTQAVGWMLAVGAFAVAAWSLRSRPTGSSDTPVYASIDAPAGYVLGEDDALSSMPTRTPFVFLPDGRSLIIQAAKDGKPQLFIRTFDRPDARPIPGTEDARVPFVSPDGKWIGFWTANQLKKVPVEGGAATTICAFSTSLGPHGATWSAQDVIVFADSFTGQLFRVPANGGTAQPITEKPPFPYLYALPVFLPDGTHVLFSRLAQLDAADTSLMVQSIDGGDKKLVLASASDGRLIAGGRLAFMRLGTLMTVGFDAARGEIRGDAVAALESVRQNGLRGRVAADPG
ncbi:MAG TPA: protein kinase, partial [Vicinamibacterales bacterium]|nr:protein kinase [Vicinamibacterales bacterium]